MARNNWFDNFTLGLNDTTTNPLISEFCPFWPKAYFETVDSSVPYIVNAALNVALSIMTTFANFLVLLALYHVTSIRLPSKLLLCSLVLTDLGAGLVVQPQCITFLLMKTSQYSHSVISCFLSRSISFLGWLFAAVSVLTMTAISLDRYTALFYHLRYQQIVTTKRVSAVLIFIWLFSVFCASIAFWAWEQQISFLTTPIFFVCLLIISVAYIKIYRGLRSQHGHQVQDEVHAQAQEQAGNTFNMARYKKTASAMLWVYALFVICFVPYVCTSLTIAHYSHTALTHCIWEFSYTVVHLNSCLNPFVYCVRLPDIRTEVLKKLRKFGCLSSQQ